MWLIESLEQRHLVTIAMQQDGRGKACRTTSNDRDVVSLADTLSRATACVAPVGEWWALTGSNRRPSRCKRDALPTELSARSMCGGAANSVQIFKINCRDCMGAARRLHMKSKLTVLATGGTIAGIAGSAIAKDYRAGEIGIEDYLERVGGLGLEAELSGTQIANIDSADVGPAVWHPLHARAMEALADEECDGLIVTHGTDTLEETAFLLDLTLPANKPVVVVGAMRPADAVGYDGLRNFANAVRVASDAQAAGRGVLVVMGDRMFAARDVYKVRTRGTEAFRGFPRESVGMVTPASLEWFGAPWRSDTPARFGLPKDLPEVAIVYVYAGLDAQSVSRQLGTTTRGVVVAGVGEGNLPECVRQELVRLAKEGTLVVRASRADEGMVDREPDDDTNAFVAARALNPQKARILLQLLLAGGETEPAAIQRAFDGR